MRARRCASVSACASMCALCTDSRAFCSKSSRWALKPAAAAEKLEAAALAAVELGAAADDPCIGRNSARLRCKRELAEAASNALPSDFEVGTTRVREAEDTGRVAVSCLGCKDC